jgi:hypothetical protein
MQKGASDIMGALSRRFHEIEESRETFFESCTLPSGRLLAFKRLKSGQVYLLCDGEIRAESPIHEGIRPWRIAQVFNSLRRKYARR